MEDEKKYYVMVLVEGSCQECGHQKGVWKPVKPSYGQPYRFSKAEAERYVDSHGTDPSQIAIIEI